MSLDADGEMNGDAKGSRSTLRGFWGRLVTISIVVIISAALLLAYFSGVLTPQRTVEIGVIIPMTGESAHLADVKDGLILAVERLNRWGGLNGYRIDLIIRDSGSDPENATELFQQMEEEFHPLMYVTAACSCTIPLLPLAEEYEAPLVGVATANVLGFAISEWAYRFYPGTEAEVSIALDILEERGRSSLGIMEADNPLGHELSENMTAGFEELGGTVEIISFCCKDTNIAEKAASLLDNDAIYIAGDFKATQSAIIAIDSLGYEGDVLTMSAAASPEISSMPESEGVFISAPAIYNPNYLPADEFREQFFERFGHEMTHFSASGYDLMNIVYGLMKDKEMTREVLNEELSHGFSYPGILGTMRVLEESHDIQYRLFPARIVEGELWYL